jgi:hypothetical protein
MRGLPAGLVQLDGPSGRSIFGGNTINSFNQFVQGLATSGYGVRVLQSSVLTKYQITSVAVGTSPGQAVITYQVQPGQTAPTFAVGLRMVTSLNDKKTLPGLSGHFQIIAFSNAAPYSVTVKYLVPNGETVLTNLGYLKPENYSGVNVFAPSLSAVAYWGSHDTKVFTRGSRGAKRAVRIRTLA